MRKHIGTLLLWAGAMLGLVSFLLIPTYVLTALLSNEPVPLVFAVAGVVGVIAGRGILNAGRQIAQDSAQTRLANDHRRPVLLLRAFTVDGEVSEQKWFRQRSLFGWLFGRSTFEEQLATIMENLGPPVALGRRGEVLPTYGFAREYVDDLRWRQVVDTYLSQSSWVVILLQAITPNLIYEIHRSLNFRATLKVLLIPPPVRFRTTAWRRGVSGLAASLPTLPTITDNTAAIIVDPNEGSVEICIENTDSASRRLTAIHRALVPKYLGR